MSQATGPTAVAPPSLAATPWLEDAPVAKIFAALANGGADVRIVGGAVRNALMGLPVSDIDFATSATPDEIEALAARAGIKTVATGREHGTLTLVTDGRAFEVTTLREDVETDGRHAVVRFGSDWEADARRRDLTMNALSVDAHGAVFDPVGGYKDILERRVRFIGEADRRIAEDRLRILRFFRFHAQFGEGGPDEAGLAAAIRGRNDLRALSAERIGQEMRKLLPARGAADTLEVMEDAGILPVVLGGVAYLPQFRRVVGGDEVLKTLSSVPLRLAALGCRISEDGLRIAERLRLANAERDEMLETLNAADGLRPGIDERSLRRLLHRVGERGFRNGVRLAYAWHFIPGDQWERCFALPDRWLPPAFPLAGRDVVMAGAPRGPLVGEILRRLQTLWVESDFRLDDVALRRELARVLAGLSGVADESI